MGVEFDKLRADFEARDTEIVGFQSANIRLSELEAQLAQRDTAIAKMNADFEARGAEISGLQARLSDKDAELELFDAQLKEIDTELDGLGLGAAAASGGLMASVRGRLASLRDREGGDVDASVSAEVDGTVNAEIERLSAELAARDTIITELQSKLALQQDTLATIAPIQDVEIMQAQLEERDAELKELRNTLELRNNEMAQLHTELGGGEIDLTSAGLMAGGASVGGGLLASLRSLRGELENKEADLDAREAEIAMLQGRIAELEAHSEPDDLTKIWGIGPKIAAVLNQNGISTFEKLADTDLHIINKMLEESGGNFGLATADIRESWHDQAVYAAEADWEHLNEVVENLKQTEGKGSLTKIWGVGAKVIDLLKADGISTYQQLVTVDTDKIENALRAARGYYPGFTDERIHHAWIEQAQLASQNKWAQLRGYKQRFRRRRRHDDLKQMWGIGPVIERVLNGRNINSFAHLARTSPDEIDEILEEAGARFSLSTEHLHESWTHQARLADAGEWGELKTYKDSLTWSTVQDDE